MYTHVGIQTKFLIFIFATLHLIINEILHVLKLLVGVGTCIRVLLLDFICCFVFINLSFVTVHVCVCVNILAKHWNLIMLYGRMKGCLYVYLQQRKRNQRTNGPVNAHLRSVVYTNKHV